MGMLQLACAESSLGSPGRKFFASTATSIATATHLQPAALRRPTNAQGQGVAVFSALPLITVEFGVHFAVGEPYSMLSVPQQVTSTLGLASVQHGTFAGSPSCDAVGPANK